MAQNGNLANQTTHQSRALMEDIGSDVQGALFQRAKSNQYTKTESPISFC